MARVQLRFKDAVITEIPLGQGVITVGRDAGNDIRIENPTVSGIHARLWQEGETVFVEDAGSTNGTLVNGQRIERAEIGEEDLVVIGKHTLVLLSGGVGASSGEEVPLTPVIPSLDKTMVLDSKIRREMAGTRRERRGELIVIEGPADANRYELSERVTAIGKDSSSLIRLKGLFAPKVAALINKTDKGFTITPTDRKSPLKINGLAIEDHHLLEEGNIIEVGGLTLRFSMT